jgi:hypothetical protein
MTLREKKDAMKGEKKKDVLCAISLCFAPLR